MTASRDPERLIRAFLDEGPIELPERAYHAVRSTIDQTPQRAVVGPWSDPRMFNRARYAVAGIATLAVLSVSVGLFMRPGGPLAPDSSPSPTSTPLAAASATPSSDAATPTVSPATSPAVAAMQAVWQDDDGECQMLDVAAVQDQGLVAVGWCRLPDGDLYGVVWYSETGFEWRRVFEVEKQQLHFVSPDGSVGGVVLASYQNRRSAPYVWRGDVSSGFVRDELPTTTGAGMVRDVAGGEGLLLAVGVEFEENPRRNPPATWASSDVEDGWERIEVPNEAAHLGPVVADGTGFVVLGTMNNGTGEALWRWEPSSGWGGPDQIPDADGFYVGNEWFWRWPGGWPESEIGERIEVYASLRVEDGFIVTGIAHGRPRRAVVATSRDGVAWQSAPLRPGPVSYAGGEEPAVYSMVEFGGRVIAVGDAVYVGPAKVSEYSP